MKRLRGSGAVAAPSAITQIAVTPNASHQVTRTVNAAAPPRNSRSRTFWSSPALLRRLSEKRGLFDRAAFCLERVPF